MGHVVTMTLTGALGLTFMFLIDAATLFWISRLGDQQLMAALGFTWTIQFFIISSGIGLSIAATALVSRTLGSGDRPSARRQASSALMMTLVLQGLIALGAVIWRDDLLGLAGATGDTRAIAAHFLLVTLPAMPFMAIAMVGGAILRALGDAWRSMTVTLVAGIIAMVLDPLFIFTFGLGIDGAAWVMTIARSGAGMLALWYMIRVHDILAPARRDDVAMAARPFFAIAAPATLTQMSTPLGNALLTSLIAGYGDAAVAGWAVVTRLTVLAFGGIFALSGAIGGILGQNYGAGRIDRVQAAYRDAVLFCLIYTLTTWVVLLAFRGTLQRLFGLQGDGGEVLHAFIGLAAGGFVFTGALFVANAAFNTLGRPLWSTAFNWSRDGLVLMPFAWAMAQLFAAPGVVYGQALAGVAVGAAASWAGWRFVKTLVPPLPAPILENGPDGIHASRHQTA